MTKNKQGAGHCRSSKEHESLFQDRGETCPLSSSLLYGGQEDMYIKSSDAHKTLSYTSVSSFAYNHLHNLKYAM